MKKKTRERNMKKVSIICLVAILVTLATQFVSCWNFQGETLNVTTGETRIADMKMSLASYVWFPASETANEFTKYVANPALRYSEKVTSEKISTKNLEEINSALLEAKLISEPQKKDDKALGNSKEKVISSKIPKYYGSLIEITEYEVDIFNKKSNDTFMAKLGSKNKTVTDYNEFVKDLKFAIDNTSNFTTDEAYYNYINKVILFPAILFVIAIAGILVILLITLKKKQMPLAPSIFALALGVLNLVNLLILPLFLLVSTKTVITFAVIYAIVALIGLINLIIDAKALKAAKA